MKYDLCVMWRSSTCGRSCERVPAGHTLPELINSLVERFKNDHDFIIAHIWIEYENGAQMFL